MASTSNITYCTDRDLQDVFPGISGFDLKRRIYNFQTTGTSNLYLVRNSGEVTQLFADGEDLGSAEANSGAVTANGEWYYDSDLDTVYYFDSATAPNDRIMEAGDDWETVKTRFRKQASRLFESRIDARLSREVSKDREGNYPDIVVRAVALQSVLLLLSANDPDSEVIESFKDEYMELVDGLNAGTIVLPTQRTADSKNGVIREVSVNASSTVRPVEIKGQYSGGGYDLIKLKVYVDGGGASSNAVIGTAKYSAWVKDSSGLKATQVVTNQTITGDYDLLASGLYVRFSGVADASVAYETDEYEIEVYSANLGVSSPTGMGSVSMTRR